MEWKAYDAKWLAELVKTQYPERQRVWKNLLQIKKCTQESRAYYYFVNPLNSNTNDTEWQFKENLLITDKKHGDIILDILEDDSVGGVEFIKYI